MAAVCITAPTCAPLERAATPPRLVVVIIMDMLPAGTLEKVRPLLPGGLGRLMEHGRSFSACEQHQAVTLTGPAHATLLSGLHPRHHGIILNDWFDRETGRSVYCAGDPSPNARADFESPASHGVSPANLRGENLPDALRRRYPGAKVFAVSGKDRSAILPAGHGADGAYWFNHATGGFTSNRSIVRQLPSWGMPFWGGDAVVSGLYAQNIPGHWDYPIRPEAAEDDRQGEQPRYSRTTPHPLREDPAGAGAGSEVDRVYHSPWLNWLVLELGGRLVEEESLGRDREPDILILGLSAGDPVGHYYGPASQEYLDVLIRTDEWLDRFMRRTEEFVGAPRGGNGVIYALSADHGVLPLPETIEGGRRIDRAALNEKLERSLASVLGEGKGPYIAHQYSGHIYFDRETLGRAGVSVREAARQAVQVWAGLDEIERVYTPEVLTGEAAEADKPDLFLELYRVSYDPERGGDVVVQPCRLCLITSLPVETSHGSPYEYDRRVPMMLMGDGIEPGTDDSACHTVDLAPTLGELLGLSFESPRDGRSLLPAIDRVGGSP